jgi:hypothetical protein
LLGDSQYAEDETEEDTGLSMQQAKQRVQQKLLEDDATVGTTDAESPADLSATGEEFADSTGRTTAKSMATEDDASFPATSRSK